MATRGGPTKLFWLVAIIITIISAGLLLLALLKLPAQEAMDEEQVKFYVDCMRRPVKEGPFESYAEEAAEAACRDSLWVIWHEYPSSGRLSREYIESLKIYHNYNQTDVDIFICGYDYRRCPNRIRALNQSLTSLEMKDHELRR